MTLDLITIGRSSVDLYGAQIGGRLEGMSGFRKYLGGSPANMAAGTARFGLKSALITRVGDEHMGRFVRERLASEGVDVRGVITDPDRLTALVILGIRDQETFPLIFYRENCADMALCEDDIDPDLIAEAKAVIATGTHLSHPDTRAAVLKAIKLARSGSGKTVLDIDYRPNLWGLSGHGDGENRFIASDPVTSQLQTTLELFDVIVGTEEEFHIAGGTGDTRLALVKVRSCSDATLVLKRGALGCVAFESDIPENLDDGIVGEGFVIDVFNVLGAGDGFMSGLMKGWIEGKEWAESLKLANACGALAVSRHGCTPAYPSEVELDFFLKRGIVNRRLRDDAALEQVHWATNRQTEWPSMHVFAFDHRAQFEEMAREAGRDLASIGEFKQLCLSAALRVADGRRGYGILVDSRLGQEALFQSTDTGLWVGRPVEVPGSRPLELEIDMDYTSGLVEWPVNHVVKALCFYHPDDPRELKQQQEQTIVRLAKAARANGLEFLLEIIPSKVGKIDDQTNAEIMQKFYQLGVYPDWWKLEPMRCEKGWQAACDVIEEYDLYCRGIVVLGLEAPENKLFESFAIASRFDRVKGFAVGRTIFAATAIDWMEKRIGDEAAITRMAEIFDRLCQSWDSACREFKASNIPKREQ
ncbi:MAG: 5-dehydro-2-deoxygluconokinase [Cohaesibacteraceae bacterium]|nr:5-dehydro-2-deoxygluconokinase [Cohaesibacteraceae bacterium]